MALNIDIITSGVASLEKMAAAFTKASKGMLEADKAGKGLTKTEQKLAEDFKKLAAEAGTTAKALAKMVKEMVAAEKALSGMQRMSRSFTSLSSNIKKVHGDVVLLNKELLKTAKVSSGKLGDQHYMAMTRNAKANIDLQKQLNTEIEKQGRLSAEVAMMGGGRPNAAMKKQIENLKVARAETEKLRAEYERLNALSSKSKFQADYARQAMQGVEAAEQLIGVQRMSRKESNLLEKQMREEAAATKRATEARRKYAQQAMTGASAARKIIGADKYDPSTASNLKKQMEAHNVLLQKQSAAASKLRERLRALEGTKMPIGQARKLKAEIHALNVALAKTGKVQHGGIASISSQLGVMEKKFGSSKKVAMDWNNSMKYVSGGIARSFGAMTYSYTALAPLLAGIAIGAAIKKVYELGEAFEYTTTYVDALNDSLESLDAGQIQEQLIAMDTLRKGPQEMAMGMKEFAKAGVDASESMRQIGEMAKFATLAEMELGDAVKLVVGQSRAFGTEYADTANMIATAALSSATNIQELGTAMSYTTELATVADVKLHEVATAMAIMANAGIRSCYDTETEVLTKEGWKFWERVTEEDLFATYNEKTGDLEYQKADRLIRYHHKGQMYKVANKGINLCVTPNHRMYVKRRGKEEFQVLRADKIDGKSSRYKTGGIGWKGEYQDKFTIPGFVQNRGSWNKDIPDQEIDSELWATFLGWYLADGHCNKDNGGNYRVVITKTSHKPEMQQKMRQLFDQLPWTYSYTERTGQFSFVNEQLFREVEPLGKVYVKHIPQYAKDWDVTLLNLLFSAMMECDGHGDKYFTSSSRLKDDIQEVALKLGYATLVRKRTEKGDQAVFTDGRVITAKEDGWVVSFTSKFTEPWWEPDGYRGAHGDRLKGSSIEIFEGWIDYDDEVFCAEVPNSLLIVRRKGRAIISGNSKAGTAIRSSIVRMLDPSEKLKGMLDDMGIAWSSFTGEGKIKDVRTMFTELKRVTDALPAEKRVAVMRELFGLRALRGGANLIRSMGEEFDTMNTKIRESTEGMSFISQKYAEVADTVRSKREQMAAEFQKSLIKAFSGDEVKGMLDDLKEAVASESFIEGMKSVVSGLNAIGKGVTSLVKVLGNVSGAAGLDIADLGLIGAMLFGGGGPVTVIAGLIAVNKQVNKLRDNAENVALTALSSDIEVAGKQYERVIGLMKEMKSGENADPAAARQYGVQGLQKYLDKLEEVQLKQAEIGAKREGIGFFGFDAILDALGGQAIKDKGYKTAVDVYLERLNKGKEEVIVAGKNVTAEIKRIEEMISNIRIKGLQEFFETDAIKEIDKEIDKLTGKDHRLEIELQIKLKEAEIDAYAGDFANSPMARQLRQEIESLEKDLLKLDVNAMHGMQQFVELSHKTKQELAGQFEEIEMDMLLHGLEGVGLEYEKIRQKAIEWGKAQDEVLSESHPAVGRLEEKLKEAFDSEALHSTIKSYQEEMDKIKLDKELVGLEGLELEYKKIEQASIAWGAAQKKALEETHPMVQNRIADLKELADIQAEDATQKAFENKMGDLKNEEALIGLKGIKLEYEKIRQAAVAWGESQAKVLDEFSPRVQEMQAQMKETFHAKGIYEIQTAIKQLDFYNEWTVPLKDANTELGSLKEKFINLQVEAHKFLTKNGQTLDSDLGKEYFRSLIENSRIFIEAIEKAKDKVRELGEEIADFKFDFNTDIIGEKLKLYEAQRGMLGKDTDTSGLNYKYQLKQIDRLKKAAAEAGKAGSKGRERQVELLKKAYNIAKSMDTSQNESYLESRMKKAYALMKKYEGASNSLKYRSRQEYIEAKQAYESAKRGDVDIDKQKRKIKEMEALGKAIASSLRKSEQDAKADLDDVKDFSEKAKKAWEDSTVAAKAANEAAEAYGVILNKNGKMVARWSNKAVSDVDLVTRAFERLRIAANNVQVPNVDLDGARAAGGPVASGGRYLVGEKGPEIFSPSSNGYIVPNHQLTEKSTKNDTVDLNLNIGNKVIPMGPTPRTSIDDLVREFEEKQRYSSGG